MSTAEQSKFLSRFDRIWAQARRVQLSQAALWGVLTALGGVAALAVLDYWFELSQPLRLVLLVAVGVAAVGVAASLVLHSFRRWQRTATAATIERFFPQLGQRIRTTIQYGELAPDEIEQTGVAGTLVAALEDDTVRLAEPLPLDAVVPWKSLALAGLLAGVIGIALAAASAIDWQWRAAARRALLADEPYTRIDVEPGHASVKEGESLLVRITVAGRTGRQVTFWSRRADEPDAEWRQESLDLAATRQAEDRERAFEIPLDRIRHPLEYRVTAGSTETETYRVEVLYPLKIVRIEAAIQPPEYTGLSESTVEGSNIAALVGSQVRLTVELDRPPQTAELVMSDLRSRTRGEQPASEPLPLAIDGAKLTAAFELTADKTFTILAQAADGMELPENKHRLRARQDEPPQVWFESPAEALEVHTLAEILMRIRVSDDFGLSRAGILFEVNNEEEYPLLMHDFAEAAAAAAELEQTGRLRPQTRATLEKILPLEHFQLTQQDSIMYYAFAEDIKPGGPQRTETDLRFIDIRPFRRLYRVVDMDGMPMGQGPQLKSLEELIARQRYALNRGIQLARKFERSGQADLSGTDGLVKFEAELARSTRELAAGLEARGIDPSDVEQLYQAEASMLSATDSLAAGSYDTATLQMRDALKHLIEGRNRLQIIIQKNPNRQQLAMLRQFDRMQQQKLRRPKSDEQQAREIAERLRQLADEEDFVYETLSGILDPDAPPNDMPSNSSGGSGTSDRPQPPMESRAGSGETDETTRDDSDDNEASSGAPRQPKQPTRQELEDRQLDIALEARAIERTLAGLPRATDLAKERMTAAAQMAEDAAQAIGRGALPEARGAAGAARAQLRELSDQVAAILAEEQADRIAAAQQMAANLARMQQDFADRLSNPGENPGLGNRRRDDDEQRPGGSDESGRNENDEMPGLGASAEAISERAQTLADVLGVAGRADSPEDQPSAERVEQMAASLDLASLVDRLGRLPGQVSNRQIEDARATAGDGADRMEAAAEQLGAIHRAIVAPRVEDLAKLEQRLTVLDDQLDQLDTDTRVTTWHMDASELLDQLDDEGFDPEMRREFLEEMRKSGWGDGPRPQWNWGRIDGRYVAPAAYRTLLSRLSADVRLRMQEYLLGDLRASGDEPIPPQYEELVDRYYRVLAQSGKENAAAPPVRPPNK